MVSDDEDSNNNNEPLDSSENNKKKKVIETETNYFSKRCNRRNKKLNLNVCQDIQ